MPAKANPKAARTLPLLFFPASGPLPPTTRPRRIFTQHTFGAYTLHRCNGSPEFRGRQNPRWQNEATDESVFLEHRGFLMHMGSASCASVDKLVAMSPDTGMEKTIATRKALTDRFVAEVTGGPAGMALMAEAYETTRQANPDSWVIQRRGDYWTVYDGAAEAVAKAFGLTLLRGTYGTGRAECAIPAHCLEDWLAQLAARGYPPVVRI